jgi:hypothetical protein
MLKNKTVTMTTEELKTVKRDVCSVWDAIGSDLLESGDCDNEQAIECCLDADRLQGTAGIKILDREFLATSYNAVLKHLSKNIRLV